MEHKHLDIRRTSGNICQETGLIWAAALPLALTKARNAPNRRRGLTPFEIVLGHPMPTGISKPSVTRLRKRYGNVNEHVML